MQKKRADKVVQDTKVICNESKPKETDKNPNSQSRALLSNISFVARKVEDELTTLPERKKSSYPLSFISLLSPRRLILSTFSITTKRNIQKYGVVMSVYKFVYTIYIYICILKKTELQYRHTIIIGLFGIDLFDFPFAVYAQSSFCFHSSSDSKGKLMDIRKMFE